jgi:hypothetical protein
MCNESGQTGDYREVSHYCVNAHALMYGLADIAGYVIFVPEKLALSSLPHGPHLDEISCVSKQTKNIGILSSVLAPFVA